MNEPTAAAKPVDPRFRHLPDDQRDLLAKYVGDMAALDSDIEAMLDKQLGVTKADSLAGPLVRGFHDAVRDQRNAMTELRDALGEEQPSSMLKEKGATVIGAVSGVIDKFRSEGIAKALRDDYAAFNLAAVSYTMLMTTAKAVGAPDVVTASEKGLAVYAAAAQKINQAIPSVVLAELASKEKVSVSAEIADNVRRTIDAIWKSTDQSGTNTSA